jgi:protoporphyrinogen IX oxidase
LWRRAIKDRPLALSSETRRVAWILVARVFGILLWVSGLLVTTIAISRHTQETAAEAREALARLERIFLRGMAGPGALLTLLAGMTMVANNPSYDLHTRRLHVKLLFVILRIVLHGAIAVTAKYFAAGRKALQRNQARVLQGAVVLVFLLIRICTLPGEVFLT